MSALLPLVGGVLAARFITGRSTVAATVVVLYIMAAAVLIVSAPDHGHSHGAGVLLAAILAPLCALAVVLGSLWRRNAVTA
jgi:hypothetical protein